MYNSKPIIYIFAVILLIAYPVNATTYVLQHPTVNYTTGFYPQGANLSVISFNISASTPDQLQGIYVNITDEHESGTTNQDILNMTVYRESGTTQGFQQWEDIYLDFGIIGEYIIVGSNSSQIPNFLTGFDMISITGNIYYIIVYINSSATVGHQFRIDMPKFGIQTQTALIGNALNSSSIANVNISQMSVPTVFNQYKYKPFNYSMYSLTNNNNDTLKTSNDDKYLKVYIYNGDLILFCLILIAMCELFRLCIYIYSKVVGGIV